MTGVDGKVRRTVDIRLKAQTMMHDFSLTEKYVVLYDLPVALDLGGSLRSRPAKALAALLTRFAAPRRTGFRPAGGHARIRAGRAAAGRHDLSLGAGRQARVGVMPREGTAADIRWFEVQPCYVFHPLNASPSCRSPSRSCSEQPTHYPST